MNYQEALDEIKNMLNDMTKNENDSFKYHYYIKLGTIDLLQELVNEKLEQESRKKKLIVGSKWECVANCYCEFWGDCLKIEKGTVIQLQSNHGHTLAISRGIMPTQQFLLCFRPLKEWE